MLKLTATALVTLVLATTAQAKVKAGDSIALPTLPTLQGKGSLDLSKYKGKVVIVDFWASWCGPCAQELPFLNGLAKKEAKDVVVIGVNLDEKQADALEFLKKHPVQIPLVYDGQKKVLAEKAEIETMPTSFIIGRDGKIVARHNGFTDKHKTEIESEVKAAIAKK